jgi:hypothetical protein
MGFFRKRDTSEDVLARMIAEGEGMIEQLAQAHMTWGLGSADRWDLDQRTGIITWTFPDKIATAPAQIIASYNPTAASWLWAWANNSILPHMSRESQSVRDWGTANGLAALTEPKLPVDDETAATLAAVALRITEATGFYRGTGAASIPIITFRAVTLTARDGTTSTFDIDLVND